MNVSVLFWTQGKRDAPEWSDCHLVMLSVAPVGKSLVVAVSRASLGARLVCVSQLCNILHIERASDHSQEETVPVGRGTQKPCCEAHSPVSGERGGVCRSWTTFFIAGAVGTFWADLGALTASDRSSSGWMPRETRSKPTCHTF